MHLRIKQIHRSFYADVDEAMDKLYRTVDELGQLHEFVIVEAT